MIKEIKNEFTIIHNTMAEYRIPLFIGLDKEINVDYLFTKIELSKEIYGVDSKNI